MPSVLPARAANHSTGISSSCPLTYEANHRVKAVMSVISVVPNTNRTVLGKLSACNIASRLARKERPTIITAK